MTSFATIVNEKVLNDYAIKIAKEFNLNGSINIQSRKVNNSFYIFEINPRFSSTVYIRNHFGFKDVLWWIKDTLLLYQKKIKIKNSGSAILGYKYNFYEEK
jgi:carbamoyl-phosphate synthase large subunit